FFSSRRRHTRFSRDWSSDVCSSDLEAMPLLSRAKQVEILVVETGRTDEEEIPGADLARHLARHKLKVDLRRVLAPSRRDIDAMRSEERRVGKERRRARSRHRERHKG